MTDGRPSLREPLLTFLAATAAVSAAYQIGQHVSVVGKNVHAFIAIVFLFAPSWAARVSKRPFDYREAGLRLDPIRPGLRVLGLALGVTWPLFALGFFLYYGVVCDVANAGPLGRLCPGPWRGMGGATLRLPDDFLLLAPSQLIVVAIPEEFFFRGYLLTRFEERWPSKRRFLGAPVGMALCAQAALFAVGHVLVDFNVQRLAVFFPGLVFGWMRSRTGSIAAGATYHALCNLFSDTLHSSWF